MAIILLFLLSFLPINYCTAAETQTQQIEDLYSWDFGQVKEGSVLKHTFILTNDSKTNLTIKDVNTSCGCTVPKVDKKTLKPQESVDIEVEFDSKGYSGPTQQFVYVNTDSLDTSTSSLDSARDDPERVKGVEGPLSVNGGRPSTTLRTALSERSESNGRSRNGRSRTIDNPVIRYIIKADVIK